MPLIRDSGYYRTLAQLPESESTRGKGRAQTKNAVLVLTPPLSSKKTIEQMPAGNRLANVDMLLSIRLRRADLCFQVASRCAGKLN